MWPFPDLEDFVRRSKSVFYPKTDFPLPDSFLRSYATQKPGIPEREVAKICQFALAETPLEVKALNEQGTFHWLYRARFAHRSVILRINALSRSHQDFSLFIDPAVMRILKESHLPSLEVYAVDVLRDRCSFDYQILEEARDRSLRDFDTSEAAIRPLLTELGRFVARLHAIQTQGFGLIDVRPLIGEASSPVHSPLTTHHSLIRGLHEQWSDYILLRLEEHVKKCVDVGVISLVEARQINELFELVTGSLANFQSALLHGDLGNHNIFTDGKRITAVIDWEDCLCGDPVFDIAFWATFHPEERHRFFLEGYQAENRLPEDFARRFWLYYLRIALSKTVLRERFGLKDRPGRPPAAGRIRRSLTALSRAA
jgi:hypothetical protein